MSVPVAEQWHSSTTAHRVRSVIDRYGSRPAVRHGTFELNYAELAATAGGVAARLREAGVRRGDVVVVLANRSTHSISGMLAAWAVGAADVHVEPTDPDARVAEILALAEPTAVLVDQRNAGRLPANTPYPTIEVDRVPIGPYRIDAGLSVEDIAYLVFTSGSTGEPKIVEVSHRAVWHYIEGFWRYMGPLTFDSFGVVTTFAADISKISILGTLLTGGRLDIYDREIVLDPAALAAELRDHSVDCIAYVPTQLETLASQGELAAVLPDRAVIVAGETFPPRLAAAIMAARPELPVFNGYGPSESTILSTLHRVTREDITRPRIPIGTCFAGDRALVLDDRQAPVPDGAPGVLYLTGGGLADGYRGDEAHTDAKFVTIDGERCYRADDLVIRRPDGVLDCLGRTDRQLKIRGNRIEPGEVEAALLATPGVDQALVVGEPADGTGILELVAYVVASEQPQGLARVLLDRLPAALVPGSIHVVPYLPTTVNGKVDLAALHTLADANTGHQPERLTADPARTTTEEVIAAIWQEVLGRDSIGRTERFLEVGGNSFKALAIFARLRKHFPMLALAQLFDHPTIADLAEALDVYRTPPTQPTSLVVEL